jgi:hypothetical protein
MINRAAVVPTAGDANKDMAAGHDNGGGHEPLGERIIAQLAIAIVSPALCIINIINRAAVVLTAADANKSTAAGHDNGGG